MVRSAGSKPPSSSRRGHQHARAGWVLQLLKGMLKGTAGRPEFFGPSFYCCYNLLFSRLISVVLKFYFPIGGFWVFVLFFFWCAPVYNLLLLVFPLWKISNTYKQWMHSCFLVPSCTPFLSELPAKSLDLAAINLTELVNGMLSTALRGNGTWLGKSQLPAQQCRRKGNTSVSRRSCKHALSASRFTSRGMLPSRIYNADGCLPHRILELVRVFI